MHTIIFLSNSIQVFQRFHFTQHLIDLHNFHEKFWILHCILLSNQDVPELKLFQILKKQTVWLAEWKFTRYSSRKSSINPFSIKHPSLLSPLFNYTF